MAQPELNRNKLFDLQRLIGKLETKGTVINSLIRQKLDFLEYDLRRLLDNSYSTSTPREIMSLFRFLYEYPQLSEVYAVNFVAGGLGQVWRHINMGPELLQLNMEAVQRGIKIHFLLLVNDWLSLAIDNMVFSTAKRLVLSGIEIKVIELSDVSSEVKGDFAVYFEDELPTCVTYCEAKQDASELLTVRLFLPVGDIIKQYLGLLRGILNSPRVKTLRLI